MLIRGYTRLFVRILWWNIFHLLVVGALVALLWSGQGQELLRISTGHQSDLAALTIGVVIPSIIFVFVVTSSGFIVGRSGEWQLEVLSKEFGISMPFALEASQIYGPLAIGLVPFVLIGMIKSSPFWLGVGLLVAAIPLSILIWQRRRINLASQLQMPRRLLGKFRLRWVIAGFLVAAFVANVAMISSPPLSRRIETIGVAMIALGSWSAVLSILFVAMPIRFKLPSLAVLVPLIWLVASAAHDPNLFPRRVPGEVTRATLPAPKRETPPSDIKAFARWILQVPGGDLYDPLPVFLVSSEGGGLRAAYWSARVLAELNAKTDGRFARHVFAYSGISGGSLGVVAFQGATADPNVKPGDVLAKLENYLGRDYLAPFVSRLLITEPCWQLLKSACGVVPRDVAFEGQLAADWQEVFGRPRLELPFLDVFGGRAGAGGPIMNLTATNVETGKRFVLSNARTSNESEVYFPFCGTCPLSRLIETMEDVTVAEAVHLSARFPYLSPPASVVTMVRDSKKDIFVRRVWGRVVDGGYFDNSGAGALSDLLDDLVLLRGTIQSPGWNAPTGDKDIDWERVGNRVRRAIFIVIVIRNDPLSSSAIDQLLIPTATKRHANVFELSDPTEALEKGELATSLPSGVAVSEVGGPPSALLATRDARGLASRKALGRFMARSGQAQVARCESIGASRRASSTNPLGAVVATVMCSGRGDRYLEISLADEIVTGERDAKRFAQNPECLDGGIVKDVALGWVLSAVARKSMGCLATTSPSVGEVVQALQ